MKISFNLIPEGVRNAYNSAAARVGYLKNFVVKVIDQASSHVQDREYAFVAMTVACVASGELSIRVARVAGEVYELAFGRYAGLSNAQKNRLALGLGGIIALTYSATNYAVYKALRMPLTPWEFVAVNVCSAVLFYFAKTKAECCR